MLPRAVVTASWRASLGLATGLVKGLTAPAGHLRIMCPAGVRMLLIPAVDREGKQSRSNRGASPCMIQGQLDVRLNEHAGILI